MVGGKYLFFFIFCYIVEICLCEIFIVFVLFIVVVIICLMLVIGLFFVLGSFLVGVVLVESEFWYELEVDIELFKGLLFGLFFIIVGVGINF